MNQKKNPFGFVRTTAIGGLLFLLPLIVVGALIGQVVPIVMTVADVLREILPGTFRTPGGLVILILLAIVVVLLLCFAAGVIARNSIGRKFSEAFEKKLLMLFPKYAILKDQMADSIGGDAIHAQMKPVLVHFENQTRVAFETERDQEGNRVTIYLPGSPDAWIGYVTMVSADLVEKLDIEFGAAVATCEQLGRGSLAIHTKTADEANP